MLARDVMRTDVEAVAPDTPASEIARRLLDKDVPALPVVDEHGTPLGMVSSEDLAGRDGTAGGAWWLRLLIDPDAAEAVAGRLRDYRTARDIMSPTVVSVSETADLHEVARLLVEHRVRRLPVTRDDRVIGTVGRRELLQALAAEGRGRAGGPSLLGASMVDLDRHFTEEKTKPSAEPSPPPAAAEGELSAEQFRHLVTDSETQAAHRREEQHRAEAERRQQAVHAMVERHLTDDRWRTALQIARKAAEAGAKEYELLRFPSELCSDGGRAINAPEADWPATLRGEAAEVYRRWEGELKPQGFRLVARVVDFPGGYPGDIGLFLTWGEATEGAE